MEMFLYNLRRKLLYSGLTKNEYESITPAIIQKNSASLLWSSLLGVILLSGLSVAALLCDYLRENLTLYLIFLVPFAIVHLLCRFYLPRHRKAAFTLVYLLLGTAYAFAIFIGVWYNAETTATTFCVLLFAIPLIVIDKPLRICAFEIAATVCICVCSYFVKPLDIFRIDLVNSISFLVLSIAVNGNVLRTKVQDLVNRRHIEKECDTDDLTRLMTRAAAEREIIALMENGDSVALIIADVDDFKLINDTYGHTYGDTVLRNVAASMRRVFRKSDILCRFGGDEFVIFLPYVNDKTTAENCVNKLTAEVSRQTAALKRDFDVTASTGVALFPQDAADYYELFICADKALYESKRRGKNRLSFFGDIGKA